MADDEILFGCKSPDDDNNFNMRPVSNLGFGQNRLNLDANEEKLLMRRTKATFTAKRTSKSSEAKTRPINKVISKSKPPIVILS